jgi:hypothetical protein
MHGATIKVISWKSSRKCLSMQEYSTRNTIVYKDYVLCWDNTTNHFKTISIDFLSISLFCTILSLDVSYSDLLTLRVDVESKIRYFIRNIKSDEITQ